MFQTQKVGSRFITYALSRCQFFKTNTKLLAAVESFKVETQSDTQSETQSSIFKADDFQRHI